ncbi:MAG: hypothetical protein D6725_17620, partial [Planctomycetota bacterium]
MDRGRRLFVIGRLIDRARSRETADPEKVMSTATAPRKKPYVGMREYIAYQLEKVRTQLKAVELVFVLIGAAAVLGGYVFLFVVLDQWVFDAGVPPLLRLLASSLVLLGVGAWIVVGAVIPCVRRVNALYAAKQIEHADPKLKGTLLSLVDLERTGRPVSPSIMQALERRAAAELAHTDVEEAVDRTLLIRAAYALLAVVVLWCGYTVLSPKRIGPSVWRALMPTARIAPATRTELYRIEPGDTEVIAGTRLPVAVDLRGEVPDQVLLLFTTRDGRFVDEPVVLKEEEPGLKRFVAILQGPEGRGLEQDITYRIEAGDARSRPFQVTVLSPPKVRVTEVAYRYPEYMGLPPRSRNAPAIDAWEGTEVTIHGEATTALKSALLVLSDAETSEGGEKLPMRIEGGTRVHVTFRLAFRPDGTAPKFYRIECVSTRGFRNPQPAFYPLNIRRDEPPDVRLLDPSGDIAVPANAIVPLAFAARDPDFRLRSVRLFVKHEGVTLRYNPFLYQGKDRRIEGQFDLSIARLGLAPGDRAEFYLQAEDNRQPTPNRTETPHLTLTITEMVPADQKHRQLAERRARQAERLEQLREQLEREWGEELPTAEEPVAAEASAAEPRAEALDQRDNAVEPERPKPSDEPATTGDAEPVLPNDAGTVSDAPEGPESTAEPVRQPAAAPETTPGEPSAQRKPRFANDGSDDQRVLEELLRQQLGRPSEPTGGASTGGQSATGTRGAASQGTHAAASSAESDRQDGSNSNAAGAASDHPARGRNDRGSADSQPGSASPAHPS